MQLDNWVNLLNICSCSPERPDFAFEGLGPHYDHPFDLKALEHITIRKIHARAWRPETWPRARGGTLQDLMRDHQELQELHIAPQSDDALSRAHNLIHNVSIMHGCHILPLGKLILENCMWGENIFYIQTVWDWSNLTHLEMWNVPILAFLKTVKAESMTTLKIFRTNRDEWSEDAGTESYQQSTDLLLHRWLKKLSNLERVELRGECLNHYAAILHSSKSTLRELSLRSF